MVAAVDADHPGPHHAAVVSVAADAERAAGRRRGVRLHRAHAGPGQAWTRPRLGRSVIPVAAAVGLAAAIAFSQDIPDVLRPDLTIAYTDTDGHGQRGDRRPPGPRSITRPSTP
ncbi:arabinofuranosyltransferase AftA domain protein [Mycobacterium xenopi 3993]|nr:arabinofuranosyltransferase AftA domain protein [Mycobacterium xenopi 3993]